VFLGRGRRFLRTTWGDTYSTTRGEGERERFYLSAMTDVRAQESKRKSGRLFWRAGGGEREKGALQHGREKMELFRASGRENGSYEVGRQASTLSHAVEGTSSIRDSPQNYAIKEGCFDFVTNGKGIVLSGKGKHPYQ